MTIGLTDETQGTDAPDAGRSRALEGVRVLDLSRFWAGPSLTEILGNLGADVIKIESIQAPDFWRYGGARLSVASDRPDRPAYEMSPIFNAVNRNKRSVTLDLSRPEGRAIFLEMVPSADLVVENYAPRVMPKFGLDYPRLRELNDRLVMISLPAFGSTGPWRDFVGFAFPTEQATGFPHLTGYEGGRPMLWGCAAADSIAGTMGAVAVMTAMLHRQSTGRGQHVELSQTEAIASFLGESMIDSSWNHRLPVRRGNRDAGMAPHGCFPARGEDQWVVVAVEDDQQWRALCGAMGRADWASEPALRTAAGRQADEARLVGEIGEWTRGRDRYDVAHRLQAVGVAAAPVLSGSDLLEEPQLRAREFVQWVDRQWIGPQAHTAMWAKFSRTPATIERPAPGLGEHNAEVFKELLGMSEQDLAELEAAQLIGTRPQARRSS